jgi:hypothetical protein
LSRPKKLKPVRPFLLLCLAVCLLLGMVAGGCAVPTSFSGYLEDRRQDLIDVLHVDLCGWQMGALAYVGPLQLGYVDNVTLDFSGGFDLWGAGGAAHQSRPNVVQAGLGGIRKIHRSGEASGLLIPISRWHEQRSTFGPRPKPCPSWFSIGLTAGYYPGLGVEFDVLELADFLIGFVCLDIGDDEHVRRPAEERAKAKVAALTCGVQPTKH